MADCQMNRDYEKQIERNRCLAAISTLLLREIDLKACLQKQGIHTYILWGAGYNGKIFYEWARKSGFEPRTIVDRNAGIHIDGMKVHAPEDADYDVDAVIVSPAEAFTEIKGFLESRTKARVILLKELAEELMLIPGMGK